MGVEKLIYDELIKFKQLEAIRPSENQKWKDSVLIEADNQRIESLLVEFNDIFTRYRLDIGYTYKFSVKVTTDTDRPEYSKTQRISIHLKDALLLELALLQYYGVITTLPFNRYSSPIFAKQKPNGNLRILFDLRKINHLRRNDNNTFSTATLADAGSHLSGTILLCKMDGSHGYFQVAMVDKKSVQLLGFNFASRTYTFHRLAQGLSRSLSIFSSFVRRNLDPLITADKYVDDIGIGADDRHDRKTESSFLMHS